MENEAIKKLPHYSLSALKSISKINILTLSLEINPKKMIHAKSSFRISNIYDKSGSFGIFGVQELWSLCNLDNQVLICLHYG